MMPLGMMHMMGCPRCGSVDGRRDAMQLGFHKHGVNITKNLSDLDKFLRI